ncbi:MAG: nucleoid-associated protein [Verrucomicrobiales bacterium]
MPVVIRFTSAAVTRLFLAKVGNPVRDEPLQTSKQAFEVDMEEREVLTPLFLKPFRNLMAHRFQHHSSLKKHEMHGLASALFAAPSRLLNHGTDIARRLYSKSNHPNIKSGDLCLSLIDDIEIEGRVTNALCILKSETITPFLSISAEDGDLKLHTAEGINPEKIDKGCLIVNHWADQGYYVLTFDRSGGESRFWVRDFLGLQAVPDSAFLTNTYAELAVAAVRQELDAATPPEEASRALGEVVSYFDDREFFDLEEFEKTTLKSPQAVAHFTEERQKLEQERGQALQTNFEISAKEAKKVRKQAQSIVALDTGFEIHIKPEAATGADWLLERGQDEEKGMKYIKLYYNEDVSTR